MANARDEANGHDEQQQQQQPPELKNSKSPPPPPPLLPLQDDELKFDLPDGFTFLETQVAGHPFNIKKNVVGMLRGTNGRVLKPLNKPALGERETAFYENLRISVHPTDIEMLRYTPSFYGVKEMRIFDKRIKFIEMEDITEGMAEPCVMDVKIGRRTWDPLATPEKRATEELKYAATKNAYGFCIAGFQVYKLPSGGVDKFDKNYGKQLDEKSLVEALEIFLNAAPNRPPCRDLVVRLLSILWKILALFRDQRRYRFYSSSLLVAYDARRLRHFMHRQLNNSVAETLLRHPVSRSKTFSARSLNSLHQIGRVSGTPSPLGSPVKPGTIFMFPMSRPAPGSPKLNRSPNGASPLLHQSQNSANGGGSGISHRPGSPLPASPRPGSPKLDSPSRSPRLHRTIERLQRLKRSISLQNCEVLPEKTSVDYVQDGFQSLSIEQKSTPKRVPNITVHKLCRTHSYSNNFDVDIIQMKENYAALLSELSSTSEEKQNWVRVYMIDFAHVFPAEDNDVDNNYLEGIESLIKLLEKFLA